MACRKAADRAMMELSGWMEQQRERNDEAMHLFLAEQRAIWAWSNSDNSKTTSVFDTCCAKWLADGGELRGHHNPARSGCSGGCGLAHPRITLEWDDKDGVAVAKVSHPLRPFTEYFDQLSQEGLAKTTTTTGSYHLTGYLQQHLDRLKACEKFGNHLIKVSLEALSQSKRAHEIAFRAEEQERESKRRRTLAAAADDDLLAQVLEVCCNHSLADHLDLAEIAWMRTSSKLMGRYAARMAAQRMRQIQLSYSVLVNGRVRIPSLDTPSAGRSNTDNTDSPEDGWVRKHLNLNDSRSQALYFYSVLANGERLRPKNEDTIGQYVVAALDPQESSSNIHRDFLWRSGWITNAEDDPNREDDYIGHHLDPSNEWDYVGHLIRMYLVNDDGNGGNRFPEQDVLFSSSTGKQNKFLETARYPFDPRHQEVGRIAVPNDANNNSSTPKLVYEITTNEEVGGELSTPSYNHGSRQYHGSFRILEIQFDFGDLLGIYVRKKLPLERQKFADIKRQRPTTRLEREYVKALAKAAREAPGSALYGMTGW